MVKKDNKLNRLKKLFDLRICLEVFAARKITVRAIEDREAAGILKKISADFRAAAGCRDYAAFQTADRKLHKKIIELADVPNLARIWDLIWQDITAFHRESLRACWVSMQSLVEEHDYIVETICGGDVDAAEDAIRNHLNAVWYRITDHQGNFVENHDALQRTLAYLTFNLGKDIKLENVAKDVAFTSSGNLSRLFKKYRGLSFQKYLRKIRLQKASDLIIHTRLPISRIALCVGYKDISRFSEHFKRSFAQTPNQFRKSRQLNSKN